MTANNNASWIGAAMPDILGRLRAGQAEAEAHAASCAERPCRRCERFVCACGAHIDGREQCRDCFDAESAQLANDAIGKLIPKRFRWAVSAELGLLQSRIQGSPALLQRALANPPTADMVLFGDTGAGKTSLVVAMFAVWARRNPELRDEAVFAESFWLAGARARHPLGQGESKQVVDAYSAPLLVVDDLGSESEDGRGVLKDVILRRHNDEKPTWITTGFTPEQIEHRYGSQVLRRAVELGKKVLLGAKS